MQPDVESFFDPATSTWSHVLTDPATRCAAVIDPVLDYDPDSGRTSTLGADAVLQFLDSKELDLQWVFETHAHADHLSGAQHILKRAGGRLTIGRGIRAVQETFAGIYNLGTEFSADGSQFDVLLDDGDTVTVGELVVDVLSTPGHTSDSMSLRCGNNVFVGDTVFGPSAGTARCDFPGGDARLLYASIQRLFSLPPETLMYLCHDYPPDGQAPAACVSIAEQRRSNIHVRDGVGEAEFVAMRTARDATLDLPRLLLPALQVNIRGGRLPEPEANGLSYLKIPLNRF